MNKTLTIRFVFLWGCFLILTPATMQARMITIKVNKEVIWQPICLTKLTKEEINFLLKDANPSMLKQLADDEKLKNQLLLNLKQMLAVACQSIKEGIEADNLEEINSLGIELTAITYDREINKNASSSFSSVSAVQIKDFYANEKNQAEFEKYLRGKIKSAKESGLLKDGSEVPQENIDQAKDFFAKTRFYFEEAQRKHSELPKEFWNKLEFSIKIQEAQYIYRLYSQKVLADKIKTTNEEIYLYIAKHPEFSTRVKKAKASRILRRAKAGENFAKLAGKFSDDPGSKDKGGLYEGIPTGQFIPEFEKAALSLKPGRIYPRIVETAYGYHIIKLIKKSETKDQTGQVKTIFDVRHILISTGVKDPENPSASEIPIKKFVQNKLEKEKEKKILEVILANNPVEIEDSKVGSEPTQ